MKKAVLGLLSAVLPALAFNWPIGVFEMIDLVGAEVVLDMADAIYQETGWERYKAAPILRRMVESGYLGRKAGKGFFNMSARG